VERSGGAVYIYEGTSNLGNPPAQPGDPGFCIPSNHSAVYDNIGVVAGDVAGESASLVIGSSSTTDRDPLLDALYGPLDNRYHHNLWYHKAHPEAIVSWGDLAERDTFAHYALLNLAEFSQKSEGYGAHSLAADPLFVDPAGYDFRLTADSPARGAASDGRDLGVDFANLPPFPRRPAAPPAPFTPGASPTPIILADRGGGLELVSAPTAISLTVGHAAYLPVEVQGYRRPITVTSQTLIHTYVNDQTPAEPGAAPPFVVGVLGAGQGELKLQTLRMRAHSMTLTFEVDTPVIARSVFCGCEARSKAISFNARDCFGVATPRNDVGNVPVSVAITLQPAIAPRTPIFGTHPDTPAFSGLTQPFDRAWGPNCGACPTTPGDPPGSTRDVRCAKQLNDSCRCHPILEILDPRADAGVRRRAPELQRYAFQFVRGGGGWGGLQHAPGQYLWAGLDWLFEELSPQERDYSPLFSGVMDGNFGWMTCPQYTNPDGSAGFFDTDNAYLLEQYAANVRAMTARYVPDLRYVELSNEPAAEFYLCPCVTPGGPACDATSGPNQPACLLGPNSREFVDAYGDLLYTAADVAAGAMAAANPGALLVTGALEMAPTGDTGLMLTTEYVITRGLLLRDNVAIGIHQYPYLYPPNWISPTLDCAYYQKPGDPYWLPAGCETAPPFEDYTTPVGRPIPARYTWQQFDQRVDSSALLHNAQALGVLDRFYLFDTELHAGWHDGDPTTTPAREAMAGLRIGAIDAHQKVIGTEFFFAPASPAIYNLMVGRLAGATPVYAWDAPLIGADYSGLVYKLFTRPVQSAAGDLLGEDIIAIWSNAAGPATVTLTLSEEGGGAPLPSQGEPVLSSPKEGWGAGGRLSGQFKEVTLTTLAAGLPRAALPEQIGPVSEQLDRPPESIVVRPLREFLFLSVISDRPGFGWLANIASSSPQRVHLPLVSHAGRYTERK